MRGLVVLTVAGPYLGRGFPGTATNGTVSPKAKRTYLPQPKEMFAIAHNMTRAHDSFFKLCPLVCGLGICYALHFLFPTFVYHKHLYHFAGCRSNMV